MQEQAKRGPGRPPKANKEAKQDIHLWLPDTLLKAIDAKRGGMSRTEYIISILQQSHASPE